MKILASGDFHGDSHLAEEVARKAESENVDLVVLCGDLGDSFEIPKNVLGPFRERNQKVLIIPGNHDSFMTADMLAEIYGATNLHGYTAVYDDIAFFGCGGANIGIEALSEEKVFDILAEGYQKLGNYKRKILVSHMHPAGTQMEHLSQFIPPSSGLRKAIDTFQPDVVLCGHIHEAAGIEEKIGKTKVVNCVRQMKIIDL